MKKIKLFLVLLIVLSLVATSVYSYKEELSEATEWLGVIVTLIPSLYFFYLSNEAKGILKRAMIFLAIGMFMIFIGFVIDIFVEGNYPSDLAEFYHHSTMIVGMIFIIFVGRELHRAIHKIKNGKVRKKKKK